MRKAGTAGALAASIRQRRWRASRREISPRQRPTDVAQVDERSRKSGRSFAVGRKDGGDVRRQQIEAWAAAEARQPALFELKTDYRPRAERNADGRYREPSLLDSVRGERQGVYR